MTVVSVGQLQAHMGGINMKPMHETSAEIILAGVQAELEMYLNRPIEARSVREVVTPDATGFAYLTYSPATRITKVIVLGTLNTYPLGVITIPEFVVDSDLPTYDLVGMQMSTSLIVPGGVMLGHLGYAIVEYEAGGGAFIDPYLPALRVAILDVAARAFQTIHDDSMSLRGGTPDTPTDPVPPVGKNWQDSELKRFERLRRRVVV